MSATLPAVEVAAPARPDRRHALALATLLLGTAGLHLWDLGALGWANVYYAGAVQAMTQDWTAFFFGSTDAGNVVTVDKPPASLWVMALSARLFGLSSWSILVPQALMGVGTVALLHAAVRRVAGPGAGLLAGAALALTPVAVEMSRYNNPDPLLVLLLVAAAYATVRATEAASTRWLLLAGALIGLAFLTKMAQAFVPLPALALAYLVAAPTGLGRRIRQLLAGGAAIVVTGGWWYAVVELWPTADRPYIGGSRTDSALELALGYNGLGRIFGREGGAGGGVLLGPQGQVVQLGPGFGSDAGILRMFDGQNGGQAGWLLPAALVLLLVGLRITGRAPRTDPVRASLLLWGGWTVITALVFSLAEGIYHSYYTVALAPGVAALVGIGGALLWRQRRTRAGRGTLAVLVAGTAAWAWVLLGRTPEFLPWLRWAVAAAAAAGVGVLLLGAAARRRGAGVLALALVLAAGLAGPAAYAVRTAVEGGQGGGPPGAGPAPGPGGAAGPGALAGPGRPGGRDTPDAELVDLLRSAGTTWSAATVGAQSSAALALTSGTAVMGVGGFSGGDPVPTLEEFQALVAAGEVRWFVEGGTGPGGARGGPGAGPQRRGPGQSSEIVSWVRQSFPSRTVGDHTAYDLTRPVT